MKTRVITAVVALCLFIPIILLGGLWVDTAAVVLSLVGLSEIFIMRKRIIVSPDFFVAAIGMIALVLPNRAFDFTPDYLGRFDIFAIVISVLLFLTVWTRNHTTIDDIGITTLAIVYIGNGFRNFIAVRQSDYGLIMLGYILAVIWATDIGAYMVGRKWGQRKLIPAISPNKTWEGSIGGTVCALVISALYLTFFPIPAIATWRLVFYAFFFSVAGQIGDLVESAYKRYYGVKDSGRILPGHGGILDRFDSLLFVLPMLHWVGLI